MICPNCGKNIPDNVRFCPECGKSTAPAPQQNNAQPQNNAQSQNNIPVPPQNVYYQQPFQQPVMPELSKPASIGQFMLYIFLFGLPVIGFIISIIMACGASSNKNITNFARAHLIWIAIVAVLSLLLTILFGSTIAILISELQYLY